MTLHNTQLLQTKICGICGDSGFTECRKTCSHCNKTTEHIYCMRKLLIPFPKTWCCEECSAISQSDYQVQDSCKTVNIEEHDDSCDAKAINPFRSKLTLEMSAVECAPLEVAIALAAENVSIMDPRHDYMPLVNAKANTSNTQVNKEDMLKPARKSRTYHTGVAQQALLLETAMKEVEEATAAPVIRIKQEPHSGPIGCDTPSTQFDSTCIIDTTLGHIRVMSRYYQDDMDLQSTSIIDQDTELQECPCWKGTFEVSSADLYVNCAMQAHFSRQLSYKAYQRTKLLSENLKFKVVDRLCVWPKIFKLDPPTSKDIGLYFYPSEDERSKRNYASLYDHIVSHDFALQCCFGDVELLVYMSKQMESRGTSNVHMWGVFRRVKPRAFGLGTQKKFHSTIPSYSTWRTFEQSSNQLKGSSTKDNKEEANVYSPWNSTAPSSLLIPKLDNAMIVRPASDLSNIEELNMVEPPPGFPKSINLKDGGSLSKGTITSSTRSMAYRRCPFLISHYRQEQVDSTSVIK